MTDQKLKAKQFKALHVPGEPIILFNVWDAGSARAIASTNAQALGTSSWAVAAAHGVADGEKLSLELVLANLQRIVVTSALPVSVDIESGYDDPAHIVRQTIEAGAIGCNVEDSFPADGSLRRIPEQVERIRAMRGAADASGVEYFINARTDVFFQSSTEGSATSQLQSALERAHAYADAGADGIFVPGLDDVEMMAELASASPLPVNIMLNENSPTPKELARTGVARLSYGPTPYLLAMKALECEALRVAEGRESAATVARRL